jgi:hypothetical protein
MEASHKCDGLIVFLERFEFPLAHSFLNVFEHHRMPQISRRADDGSVGTDKNINADIAANVALLGMARKIDSLCCTRLHRV